LFVVRCSLFTELMNFNKAVVVGNLTRDPEVRNLPSGQSVASFGVATNRVWTDQNGNRQEATEFHNVVAFGKLADICSRYLSRGRLVLIEGRIQTRSWQGQDGNKRYRTEIVADNMQMGPRTDIGAGQARTPKESKEEPVVSQEEIPVIEAEEPIGEESPESIKEETASKETASNEKEEVDLKDIPF